MGVTLTQSPEAAFPDRPRDQAGVGLHVTLTIGDDAQYLPLSPRSPLGRWHIRFLINTVVLDGGSASLCTGQDVNGDELFQLRLDQDQNLHADIFGLSTISAALPDGLPWTCVELGVDLPQGSATLWVNGVEVGQSAATASGLELTQIRFGVVRKSFLSTGGIHLDEVALGEDYLGPVITEPVSPYADDPARWLLIYNTNDSESVVWAETYRAMRGLPYANLLGLALPTSETIEFTSYQAMLSAIETYLDTNRMRPSVMGLLLGYHVPGYVQDPEIDRVYPVGSMLANPIANLLAQNNPLAAVPLGNRLTTDQLAGLRLTARIDAPNLSEAVDLIERSIQVSANPLPSENKLFVDPLPDTPAFQTEAERLTQWHTSLDRQRLRIESPYGNADDQVVHASLSHLEQDAFYWGWSDDELPEGFYAAPAGVRTVSVQMSNTTTRATTLRDTLPSHWIDTALHAGYAAAVGSCNGHSSSSIPLAGPFFSALSQGWTLGEAWFAAQPTLRDGLYLVGDPFMTVRFPKAGWDIFGPLIHLEQLDPETPRNALPAHIHTWRPTGSLQPTEGTSAHFLIRQLDASGRSEAGVTSLSAHRQLNTAELRPGLPAWPIASGWRLEFDHDQAVARLILPSKSSRHAMIEQVELIDEHDELIHSAAVTRYTHHHSARLPIPAAPTRYRWRLISAQGVSVDSPRSAALQSDSLPASSLTLLES